VVRAQIADGTLKPGSTAPSGAAIGRLTGFSAITCRKALRALIKDGTLVPGASPNARPRVAASDPDPDQPVARATRELSAALAARRYNAGLTQVGFAAVTGYSVTTVGHAETGRTWQSRRFWERADDVLSAGGELLRLYDARRAAGLPSSGESATTGPEPDPVCVLVIWRDGSIGVVPRSLADFIVFELRADPLPLQDERKIGKKWHADER
jgi:hypothetical protein